MEWKFKVGDKVTFNTVDSELRKHNGTTCEVARRLTDLEADLCETGPMYELRTDDGVTVHAFEDEMERA